MNAEAMATRRLRRRSELRGSDRATAEGKRAGSLQESTIELGAQQRLVLPCPDQGDRLVVWKGMLAVDATPRKGERQILNFLMPGDLVMVGLPHGRNISVRALSHSVLRPLPAQCDAVTTRIMLAQLEAQQARASVHLLTIGHLDAEGRTASFLHGLALRSGGGHGGSRVLDMAMSRDDAADYLALNRDTLSRVMARFEASGVIQRLSRHSVRVSDLDALARLSPIASLTTAAFADAPDARRDVADNVIGIGTAPPRIGHDSSMAGTGGAERLPAAGDLA